MHLLVDGYLNTIETEGVGLLLNGACDLYSIEQNNSKLIYNKHAIQLIKKIG